MPELPEVETVRRILAKEVLHRKIISVEVFREQNLDTDPADFKKSLEGHSFNAIDRAGKYLLFRLDSGLTMVSHLRMEGKYYFEEEGFLPRPQDLLYFHFEDGHVLVYNDVRKFGRLGIYDEEGLKEAVCSKLGPEPFDLTPESLHASLQKKSTTIKEALLDQSIVAGLGNIYDDETLFAAKIHPLRQASSITLEECEKIVVESRRILNEAISLGGSTVKSYHPEQGVDGKMQSNLLVYGRENEPCSHCGFPLRKIFIGGRGTVYCPKCQVLSDHPFVLGVTGPIHAGKSTVSHYLESRGYHRFDADACVKELYAEKKVQQGLRKLFGRKAVKDDKVDFAYLRQAVASSKEKKQALNEYVHPLVLERAKEFIAGYGKNDKIVLDVPLLFGSGLDELCDATLLVEADELTRFQRLQEEGKDAASLLKVNKGYPLAYARKKASFIVETQPTLEGLYQEIDHLPLFD